MWFPVLTALDLGQVDGMGLLIPIDVNVHVHVSVLRRQR